MLKYLYNFKSKKTSFFWSTCYNHRLALNGIKNVGISTRKKTQSFLTGIKNVGISTRKKTQSSLTGFNFVANNKCWVWTRAVAKNLTKKLTSLDVLPETNMKTSLQIGCTAWTFFGCTALVQVPISNFWVICELRCSDFVKDVF